MPSSSAATGQCSSVLVVSHVRKQAESMKNCVLNRECCDSVVYNYYVERSSGFHHAERSCDLCDAERFSGLHHA
jgi:hypothetical protein